MSAATVSGLFRDLWRALTRQTPAFGYGRREPADD